MSDIVNAFKQTKGYKKRKNLLSDTQEVAQQPQEQETDNQALNASQQQNIALDTSGTKDSDRLAQLEQLAAAETAQNEANKQAAQAAAQAQQKAQESQNRLSEQAQNVYNNAHNDMGWKKYYDEEKQKVRDSAFKNDGFGSWLQDVFNAGWDSRLAESQARNRYASELNRKAFDDNGNVSDQNALYQAQGIGAYNSDRIRQLGEIEHAKGKALGATYDSDFNPFEATANAIRNMDLGNAILQGDESDAAGVGKFLINLVPGMLSAPITGGTNISEAISGQGLDSETGERKQLDDLERIGRGLSGAIDAAGVFYGGSGEAISSLSNQIFKKGATEAAKTIAKQTSKDVFKGFVKSMLQEGTEEAVQQAFEFFGDGGKIITKDGEFDGEAFKELAGQVAQAGGLGALGGGIFHGVSLGTNAIGSNLNNRRIKAQNTNTNLNENTNLNTDTNQDLNVGDTDTNENVGDTDQNIEQQAKDVSTETNTNITPTEMAQNADASARVVEKSDALRDILNDSQKQSFNDRVKEIRSDLEQNKISYTEYLQKVEALQNEFSQQVEGAAVQQREKSATGQQVNPNDIVAVQNAEGTNASENFGVNKYDGTTVSLDEYLNETKAYRELSDAQKQSFLDLLNDVRSKLANSPNAAKFGWNGDSLDMAIINQTFDRWAKEHKIARKMFNSKENQDFLKQLGIDQMTNARYGKSDAGGRHFSTLSGNDSITIYLEDINQMQAMKSIEVHEAAHATWERLTPQQRTSVSQDLLTKIGLDNIKVNDKIQASRDMNEIVAYATQFRWEDANSNEKFASDPAVKAHIDNLLKYVGSDQKINLRESIIQNVKAFVTYLKGKITGIVDAKTFDDFYNGLVNGDFANDLRRNVYDVNGASSYAANETTGSLRGVLSDYTGLDENTEQKTPSKDELMKQLQDMMGEETTPAQEARAAEDANNAFGLGKKDLKRGVELAEGFADDPQGYEQAAINDNIPIAYDYDSGQYLYFLNDVYEALDANKGKDVNGVEFETPTMANARRADESAKQRWESLKQWNDDLKARRQAGEISQYEYEQQLDLPSNKEDMKALGKYFDNNYVKSLGITGNYEGDAAGTPPIWGNKYRGSELTISSPAEQIVNNAMSEPTQNAKQYINSLWNGNFENDENVANYLEVLQDRYGDDMETAVKEYPFDRFLRDEQKRRAYNERLRNQKAEGNTAQDVDAINNMLAEAAEADRGFTAREDNTAPEIDPDFDSRVKNIYGQLEMEGMVRGGSPTEAFYATQETNTAPEAVENPAVTELAVDENIFRQQDMARRQELLQAYNEIGMTPELQQKIQEANRNMVDSGATTADLSALTPQEMDIYRRTLEFYKPTENVESSMNRAYLPQQYEMDTEGYANRRIQEFLDTGKNDKYWEQSRTGAVAESGRMDYSNNALVDFHMRAENPTLLLQEAGYDMAQELNPDATQDQKIEAANDIAETVSELNNKAEEGTENGISDKDIQGMKPADKLSEAGKKLGVQREQINNTPKGFSDYEKLKSLNQWEKGARFSDMQNLNALSQNTAQEVDAMIQGYENLSDKAKQEILSHRRQLEAHFTESTGSQEMGAYLANRAMLKDAWTQNMMNYATKVEFTNKASKKLMNEYVARYLLKDRYEQSTVQKIGSAVQRVMNSSFRGARVQTTLNEIPEIFTSMADYGTLKTASIRPSQAQAIKAKYGMSNGGSYEQFMNTLPKADRAEIQTRLENARSANEQINIFKEAARKAGKVLDTADGMTQWNGFVQDWKDATFLQNAERYYTQKGLSGVELTNRVLDDFYQRMLPMNRVFKYIKSDAGITKPILMYLDSSARLTMKAARGAVGSNMVGVNANMGRMHRIARNAAFDLAPRALSALVMGVPLASVIGMFNIGGADYSGIDDEDKNMTDHIVNLFGQLSPLLSLAAYGYNQGRQEEIAKAKGQDTTNLKGDAGQRAWDNIKKTFTPLGNRLDQDYGIFGNINSTFGNLNGVDQEEFEKQLENSNMTDEEKEKARQQNLANLGVLRRGYGENKQGRVQYLSPDNPVDMVNAIISGMNRTSNAREYNKNPDLLSALINQARGEDYNGDGNIDGGFNDFIRYNQALNEFPLDLGLKDENDYNRPLNQYENSDYSGMVKDALERQDRAAAQEWYEKGRAYNALLDNLRVKNPYAADVYYASMGNNLVSPEKWKTVLYGQNPNGEPDLTVWNLMKDMALKRGEDFGTPVDPAYTNLDDEQTRRYLQYKSTATGEDTALKKIMTQDPFWKEFFNQQKEYWASQPQSEWDDSGKTARVQEWNDWNDQYGDYMSFISGNLDGMNDQQLGLSLSLQFPLMAEYQSLKTALQSKYGDEYKNSQEYKNFWSQNYDAYSAESDAFNGQMLYIINQMRRIEGYDDLTLDELETINDIGKESKSSNKSGGYSRRSGGGSSGGGGYSYAQYFENTFQAAPVYAKVPNAGKMKYNPAGKANFAKVPMSGTMGGQPYAAV